MRKSPLAAHESIAVLGQSLSKRPDLKAPHVFSSTCASLAQSLGQLCEKRDGNEGELVHVER
jgi:hypothetical protein